MNEQGFKKIIGVYGKRNVATDTGYKGMYMPLDETDAPVISYNGGLNTVKDIYIYQDSMDIIDISYSLFRSYTFDNGSLTLSLNLAAGLPPVRLCAILTPSSPDIESYVPFPPKDFRISGNEKHPFGYSIKQKIGDYSFINNIGTDEAHPHIGPTSISSFNTNFGESIPAIYMDDSTSCGKYNDRIITESWWDITEDMDYTAHMRIYIQPYMDMGLKIPNNSCFPMWIGFQTNTLSYNTTHTGIGDDPLPALPRYNVTITSRKNKQNIFCSGRNPYLTQNSPSVSNIFALICAINKLDNNTFEFWRMEDYGFAWGDGGYFAIPITIF